MELSLTEQQKQRRQTLIDLRASNYSVLGMALEREVVAFATSKPSLSPRSPDAPAQFAEWLESNRMAQLWSEVQQRGQELMWAWAEDVVSSHGAELRVGPPEGPGSLELDPDLKMPAYFDVDFHLQPNGYLNPLSGFVYDTMVPLFYMGRMPLDHYAQSLSAECPVKNPKRMLDLAAGVGHSTLQWAKRYPGIEIDAIDLSGSMLQCLLWNARQNNVAVRCRQMNAEELDYADGSFDIVTGLLLMHELPEDAIRNVAREALRVLKPDGVYIIADHVPIGPETTLFQAFHRWWDTHHNGEPYVDGFVKLDLMELLKDAGFEQVEEREVRKPSGHAASAIARAVFARPKRQ
jgi:ubiquinone/menaquinone biosynthesis C-methylase UbiE